VVTGIENAIADDQIEQHDGALDVDLEANDPPPPYCRISSNIALMSSCVLPEYICGPHHIVLLTMGIASILVVGFMFVYWDTFDRV
jgi:hypothetical protein